LHSLKEIALKINTHLACEVLMDSHLHGMKIFELIAKILGARNCKVHYFFMVSDLMFAPWRQVTSLQQLAVVLLS